MKLPLHTFHIRSGGGDSSPSVVGRYRMASQLGSRLRSLVVMATHHVSSDALNAHQVNPLPLHGEQKTIFIASELVATSKVVLYLSLMASSGLRTVRTAIVSLFRRSVDRSNDLEISKGSRV